MAQWKPKRIFEADGGIITYKNLKKLEIIRSIGGNVRNRKKTWKKEKPRREASTLRKRPTR